MEAVVAQEALRWNAPRSQNTKEESKPAEAGDSWRGPQGGFTEGLSQASAFTLSSLKSMEKILDVAMIQPEICFRMSPSWLLY